MSHPNGAEAKRLAISRLRLQGTNCQVCGTVHFPPQGLVCRDCAARKNLPSPYSLRQNLENL